MPMPRKKIADAPTEEKARTPQARTQAIKPDSPKKTRTRAATKPKRSYTPTQKTPVTTPLRRQSQEQSGAGAIAQPSARTSAQAPVFLHRSMGAMACFVYGAVICLVGTIGIGLLLGLVVLPPLIAQFADSSYSHAAPLPKSDGSKVQSPAASEQVGNEQAQEYGFYGTLLSKEEDVLTVQELLPPLPLEREEGLTPTAKTFIVRVTPETSYTHQKPRAKDDLTSPLFTPVEGSLEELLPRIYLFVNTPDDPSTIDTVTASHVLYSELSPFTE